MPQVVNLRILNIKSNQNWKIMIPGSETIFNGMRNEQPSIVGNRA